MNKQPDKKADIGKEAAIEAEVRAARERALVPLEIRVKSFKEMLKEKDVSATCASVLWRKIKFLLPCSLGVGVQYMGKGAA